MIPNSKQRRQLERDNKQFPDELVEVPIPPSVRMPPGMFRVMRSRKFLCQFYRTENPYITRLSICRTTHTGDDWSDGITWDHLQQLKREAGYGNRDAVEVFPDDRDVVNVANMRHLFVFLAERLDYAWRKP